MNPLQALVVWRGVNIFPAETLNLSGPESEEECKSDDQLTIDVLDESGDDVLSLFKRVVRCLAGFLGLSEYLDIVPRVGLDDTDVDRMGEDA